MKAGNEKDGGGDVKAGNEKDGGGDVKAGNEKDGGGDVKAGNEKDGGGDVKAGNEKDRGGDVPAHQIVLRVAHVSLNIACQRQSRFFVLFCFVLFFVCLVGWLVGFFCFVLFCFVFTQNRSFSHIEIF